MLNIHLGDTVVTALAKCIFFYNSRKAYCLGTYGVIRVSALAKVHFFWTHLAGANFFSDCFFLSERLRFRSPRIVKERASASDNIILYSMSPRASEASGGRLLSSLLSLFQESSYVFIICIVRRAKRAVNVLCLLSS